MKYYVIVGEPSGDLHASKMMQGIEESDPNAEFRFFGGDKMAQVAGKEAMTLHYKEASFMGFWRVVANLGTILSQMALCKRDIAEFNPDVVILVDYAGFNLRIARFAKERGYKVYYYIAPKVWAWKKSRVKKIKQYVDRLFVIFPFEVEFFSSYGIKTYYDGNPIMDAIETYQNSTDKDDALFEDMDKSKTVALLCGSRRSEIRDNLPYMASVAKHFPDYKFIVAGVSWIDRSIYEECIKGSSNITIVADKTYDVLSHSTAAMVTSGTATLETALLGVPEVVCYWVSRLSSIVGKIIIRIKFISLVNIVMQREVVRELLYAERMTLENGVTELKAILEGGVKREKMLSDYRELSLKMGSSGSSKRTAQRIVALLKEDI